MVENRAILPTETIDLGVGGLSLRPRLKLLLTFFRAETSVRPIDEWKLKSALLEFLRDSLAISAPDEDLTIQKLPDQSKRKRDDPIAAGKLFVRDFGLVLKGEDGDDIRRRRFVEWRESVLRKMDEIELNIEGAKFFLKVEMPPSDDFDLLKKSWEDSMSGLSSSRGVLRRPDTIVVSGVPSRWFAEPRVSSKPSMLVTHTVFSVLGKIRNLNVASDDGSGKGGDLLSGLHCKVWVQFEDYNDFCAATKALCGRSMCKEGSRLKSDYEVSWDKGGYFRVVQGRIPRSQYQEKNQPHQYPVRVQSEVTRVPKRFRE
ncbi:ZCW7 [Wolffia australiana]